MEIVRSGLRLFQRIRGAMFLLLIFALQAGAADLSLEPSTNHGKRWRIGYYEGGIYKNYPINLLCICQGLAQLGWLKQETIAAIKDSMDSRSIWQHLTDSPGPYIEFSSNAFWSSNWQTSLRHENRKAILSKLKKKEIDFMIAMGTWAGQDLVNQLHCVPTMVVSTSDPVQSGIIKSPYDSGFNHVHVRCDPNRYKRQLHLFHNIFEFKRLGLVYEDTIEGRSYAAVNDVRQVAKEKDFQVISCEAPFSGVLPEASTDRLIQCHRELAPKIDALFMTVHRGVDEHRMDEIMAPLLKFDIPTWSQRGSQEVKKGVLMSISRKEFKTIGTYHAEIMARILNGAKPRDLNQIFEDPQVIAINLKTAAAIGFRPPKGLMKVVDEIYE